MREFFRTIWNHICRGLAAICRKIASDPTGAGSTAPAPKPSEPDEEVAAMLPSIEHLRVEFDPRGDSVQWETAITLAELCLLAYTEPHNRTLVTRLLGCDETVILEEKSMSGFMTLHGDAAVIAFRGTDLYCRNDWLTNFRLRYRTELGAGREIHRGFYDDGYGLFAAKIKGWLEEHRPKYTWITGHSLGGAMAACCAYDLAVNNIPFTGVVTFGQPRIGNQVMAQYLQDNVGARYLRFVNEGDFVPRAPPGIGLLLSDYWHCGARIRFKEGKLDRWYGLNLFSATGPVETPVASEASDDVGQDGEATLTKEEFQAVQEYLRAMPPPDAEVESPAGHSGNAPPVHGARKTPGPPAATAMSGYGEWIGDLYGSIKQRVDDHSMDEYVSKLNVQRLQADMSSDGSE